MPGPTGVISTKTASAFPSETIMTATPLSPSRPTTAPARRRVMDATTRALHWLMALSFTGAYLTADGERWRLVHVTLGYTLGGLLGARLLWGLFGPRQVRLSVLWRKLRSLPTWLAAPTNARLGQNVLMALAVALILSLILPLTLSGYAVWDEWGGEWLEEVHEFFGNALLAVVLLHIGLIVLLSLWRRQNQALPMLTGRGPGPGPDVASRHHGWLALALVGAVVAFWLWQWSGAPGASPSDANPTLSRHERQADHDDD